MFVHLQVQNTYANPGATTDEPVLGLAGSWVHITRLMLGVRGHRASHRNDAGSRGHWASLIADAVIYKGGEGEWEAFRIWRCRFLGPE